MEDANIDFAVEGVEKFKELRRRLKDADKEIRLAFLRAVREAVSPLADDIRQSALAKLPRRGGLAAHVADAKFATRNRMSSVSFQMKDQFQIQKFDDGLVRHPVFGTWRADMASQVIPSGFWTDPVDAKAPDIRQAVSDAMDETAAWLEHG